MNLQTSQARWLFFVDSIKLLSGTNAHGALQRMYNYRE